MSARMLDFLGAGQETFAFLGPVTRAWEFGAGALLACLSPGWRPGSGRWRSATGWAGAGLIVAAALLFDDTTAIPGLPALVRVAGTLLVIGAGSEEGAHPRWLGRRGPTAVGDVSYGLYLWHWPALVFARALWPGNTTALLGAVGAASVVTWASYRLVENPIRFRPAWTWRSTAGLTVACVAAPLAASGLALQATGRHDRVPALREFDRVLARHAGRTTDCSDLSTGGGFRADCTWPVAGSREHAVLIGDSNADQFTEAFVAAANGAGLDGVVAWKPACPFIHVVVLIDGRDPEPCRRFVTAALARLRAAPPRVVIVAAAADHYVERELYQLALPEAAVVASTPAEKAAYWEAGLRALLRELEELGAMTVVVHPVPKFEDWDPRRCAVVRAALDMASCGTSEGRTTITARQARAVAAERAAVGGAPGVRLLDLADDVCSPTRCSVWHEGIWWWRDGGHLSVDGSRALVPRFAGILRALGLRPV